ncbi:MAG: hypothetical protein HYY04_16455 [Chloroflexi bacterium]|nr:hypothetical protein [Chloroflexota bacterium]
MARLVGRTRHSGLWLLTLLIVVALVTLALVALLVFGGRAAPVFMETIGV